MRYMAVIATERETDAGGYWHFVKETEVLRFGSRDAMGAWVAARIRAGLSMANVELLEYRTLSHHASVTVEVA